MWRVLLRPKIIDGVVANTSDRSLVTISITVNNKISNLEATVYVKIN